MLPLLAFTGHCFTRFGQDTCRFVRRCVILARFQHCFGGLRAFLRGSHRMLPLSRIHRRKENSFPAHPGTIVDVGIGHGL